MCGYYEKRDTTDFVVPTASGELDPRVSKPQKYGARYWRYPTSEDHTPFMSRTT